MSPPDRNVATSGPGIEGDLKENIKQVREKHRKGTPKLGAARELFSLICKRNLGVIGSTLIKDCEELSKNTECCVVFLMYEEGKGPAGGRRGVGEGKILKSK